MKKSLTEFIDNMTEQQQEEYLKNIIEQEQHISKIPEEYFPEDRSKLVVAKFEKSFDKIFVNYIECSRFAKNVSFFSDRNGGKIKLKTLKGNFNCDKVYLCKYEIDKNMCNRDEIQKDIVFYIGTPLKLTIETAIADSMKEFCNMFKSIRHFEEKINELSEQKDNLQEEYDKQKKEIDMKIQEYKKETSEQAEQEIQKYNTQIDELSEKKEQLIKETDDSENKLSELKSKLKVIEAVAEKFGVNIYKENIIENPEASKTLTDYTEMVDYVHSYLANNGMYYDKNVIQSFAGGLLTNQIIILSGESGTGKSSLPVAFAEVIGAEYRLISVQPSWTDNQDLLGFFDFSKGYFVPTPFMDVLVEASMNPDTIYIVCLDEMNLVRVEYYFSEILSTMESKDKTLHLYSKYLYNEIIDEFKYKNPEFKINTECGTPDNKPIMSIVCDDDFKIIEETRNDEQYEAMKKIKKLFRYPSDFKLPENIQFVGTLNMDETTKSLSPKVLDRSFVIEVGISDDNARSDSASERLKYSYKDYKKLPLVEDEKIQKIMASYHETVKKLKTVKQLEVTLSRRNEKNIKELLEKNGNPEDVFMGKILPSLNGMNIGKNDFEKIRQILENGLKSKKILERLNKMYDESLNEISFWRKSGL